MIGAKITKVLGDNRYEVEIDPVDVKTDQTIIGVAHDYVLCWHWTSIQTANGVMIKDSKGSASNNLNIRAAVQIPIRVMGEIGLPLLNESPYLKEEHYSRYGVWNPDAPVKTWGHTKQDKTSTMHIFDKTAKKYVTIPKSLYHQLTGTKNEEIPDEEEED